MAKSLRSSTRKANNQRLKGNVFGPVEAERMERLSAKLLEIAAQPKPQRDTEMKADDIASDDGMDSAKPVEEDNKMDVDSSKPAGPLRRTTSKKIEKRKKTKSRIVFPKYKDRKTKGKK